MGNSNSPLGNLQTLPLVGQIVESKGYPRGIIIRVEPLNSLPTHLNSGENTHIYGNHRVVYRVVFQGDTTANLLSQNNIKRIIPDNIPNISLLEYIGLEI